MTSRVLVAETPPLSAIINRTSGVWELFPEFTTNWRIPRLNGIKVDGAFLTSTVIDLSGYAMQDMTTYFRRSFEQVGAPGYSANWDAAINQKVALFEQTIISSVPFNDDQIIHTVLESPGFISNGGYSAPTVARDVGNFDRTHIIHGHFEGHFVTDVTGAAPISGAGSGYLTAFLDNYYSSLEPTAADCLYVYRIVITNNSTASEHFEQFLVPAKRVILDVETDKEDHLSYMMRLARSYELANQV